MDASDRFNVKVVCAWPDRAFAVSVWVDSPTTVEQVVQRSGVLERFSDFKTDALALGIFGRIVPLDYVVRPGDRIEILRPLIHDPKEARRLRASQTSPQSSGPGRST